MDLRDKILNPSIPVSLFEVVPPAADRPEALETSVQDLKKIQKLVDGINLPEIHDEDRGGQRTSQFVPRVEPRQFAARILGETATEVVVNRVVVHDPEPERWFRETHERWGIRHAVLVGGESAKVSYPGPGVLETARRLQAAGLPLTLGGITIPSRENEPERLRRKAAAGLQFFTSQILFDSNDIVWLIQRLNGLEARVLLSFAPVSHRRDLEFLRWLGADVPRDLDRFLLGSETGAIALPEICLERSLALAQRILMDIFDNLPPDPPPLGINIEHINRRNFSAAVKMLERLGNLYANLVAARSRASLA